MTQNSSWWQDRHLLLAFLLACSYWILLAWLQPPETRWLWPLSKPLEFLLPVLIYPILEEIVFRGLLQGEINNHLRNCQIGILSCANLLTSVIFTALHFIHHPPLWAIAVFIPSLIFGYFKDRTGHLGAPIALHVFYNGGYFLIFTHQGA
ncbi:MAG: JDVT-CTERM system glutamic-type intramembrane protease [Gammaproteobacteria bacterium]